jgi:hypothetical protein
MSKADDMREKAHRLADKCRNKRQAAVLLSEVARKRCDAAANSISDGDRLVARGKELQAHSKALRSKSA